MQNSKEILKNIQNEVEQQQEKIIKNKYNLEEKLRKKGVIANMSEFHTKELEKSIKDFKKTIENSYAEISFLEKKKNINFDFYDLNNKEIDYKIETQKDIIDCFSKKIRKNNELLLKFNFKKVPPFLKTDINSNDNKIEKSKLINAKTGKKIKL